MSWTMGLAVYAAAASTLVVYLRIANARRERRWREAERTIDAAISAAIHHLPPAKPNRVMPTMLIDEYGADRGMRSEYIEIDWDGHKREAVRRLLTAARKSVHT